MKLRSEQGFSLIEVLVAVLVLTIGLLGLFGMQLAGVKSNQSAYFRTQASLLASDMADRLRFNSDRAIAGGYDGFSTANSNVEKPSCWNTSTGCNETSLVDLDKAEWTESVEGGDDTAILLPNASGTIVRGAGNLFTVQIQWDETTWDEDNARKDVVRQTYAINLSL